VGGSSSRFWATGNSGTEDLEEQINDLIVANDADISMLEFNYCYGAWQRSDIPF